MNSPSAAQLRTLLIPEGARRDVMVPLRTVAQWVEDAARIECRDLMLEHLRDLAATQFNHLTGPRETIAFAFGSERFHLNDEALPKSDGIEMVFTLSRWPGSPATEPARLVEVPVAGVGRVCSIALAASPGLLGIDIAVAMKMAERVGYWYYLLADYCERSMRGLMVDVVDEMLAKVRIAVPPPYGDAIWLYTVVKDYGISMTDAVARRRLLTALLTQRGAVEASPIEAAISLIAVEMERGRSFSDTVLRSNEPTEIALPETAYSRLIQDTERLVYGSNKVLGMRLATTPNGDLGVVAAFPTGDIASQIIVPSLTRHLSDFQVLLDRLGWQFDMLIGRIDKLVRPSAGSVGAVQGPGPLRVRLVHRVQVAPPPETG